MCDRAVDILMAFVLQIHTWAVSVMLMNVWVINKICSPEFPWHISWPLGDFSPVVWFYENGHKELGKFALCLLSLYMALHKCATATHRVHTQAHELLKWGSLYQCCTGHGHATHKHLLPACPSPPHKLTPFPLFSPQTPSHNRYSYFEERGKNSNPTDS